MDRTPFIKVTNARIRFFIISLAAGLGLVLAIHTGLGRSAAPPTVSNTIARGTSTNQWFWQNPLPTGNYLTGVNFTDSKNGTFVGIAGTIMRTSDGGLSLASQSSGTASDLFGVYFTDASTGTAVGGDGTILRTTDSGTSWTPQGSPSSTFFLGVYFTDTNTGTVVGTEGTILRTTDGG